MPRVRRINWRLANLSIFNELNYQLKLNGLRNKLKENLILNKNN